MPGPTLSLTIDPAVLLQLGEIPKAAAVAQREIAAIEKAALKAEKAGKTLDASQIERLKKFEKIQDTARGILEQQRQIEKIEKTNHQTVRDVRMLHRALTSSAFTDLANGQYLAGVGRLLESRWAEKGASRLMERFGASAGFRTAVTNGLAQAHMYGAIISSIVESAEKLHGRSSGGEGSVWDPRGYGANFEAKKRLASGQWGYRQQREFTDQQDGTFSFVQNPFGDSKAEKALKQVDFQTRVAELMGTKPPSYDPARRTDTYRKLNQDMFQTERDNRVKMDRAMRVAMRKSLHWISTNGAKAGDDATTRTFKQTMSEAFSQELNQRRKTYGQLKEEDYRQAGADAFLKARDALVASGRMTPGQAKEFGEKFQAEVASAGILPATAHRNTRLEQAKQDAEVRKNAYWQNWQIEQNRARYNRDHLPMKWDD